MKKILKSHSPVKHAKSFKYAFEGIGHALVNEANFRVQMMFVMFELILGIYFKISNVEWGLLVISMGVLLSAEMFNTVIEAFVDHLVKGYDEGAKIIKDLAAGFVLVSAITAVVIFGLVFAERLSTLLI